MKAFYSEYVRHCMKFYTRHPRPDFKNEIDRLNWQACDCALESYPAAQRRIFRAVYSSDDTMPDNERVTWALCAQLPDNVYQAAKELGVDQSAIWKLIKDLERRIAKRRMLI